MAAGFGIRRLGVARLLAGSTALAAAALAGFGAAPALLLVVGAALFLGIGSGAIDAGLNAYAARHFGARHMNWLHASWGLGATLGPLVLTAALGTGLAWRWGYGAVAVAQASLAVAFMVTARAWAAGNPGAAAARSAAPASGGVRTLRLTAVWRGAAAFTVYTGAEAGAGLWAYTLLTEERGMPERLAGLAVSAYWGSLFAGRLIFGVVAERVGSARVLTGSMVGMVAGAVLVAFPGPVWLSVTGSSGSPRRRSSRCSR